MFFFSLLSKIVLIIFIIITFIYELNSANLFKENLKQRIKIFYTLNDQLGWYAGLKGKIVSIERSLESKKENTDIEVTISGRATVRLYSSEGIKVGDTLFVIGNNNHIKSKIEVKTIFYSNTFGFMLTGIGNLKHSLVGDRVVQRLEDHGISQKVIYHKAKGDYYNELGQTGKSIYHYYEALKIDSSNPDVHLSLGNIYLNKNMLEFAYREFYNAYKEIERIYDKEDRFNLLQGLVKTRYKEAYYQPLPKKLRIKFIKEGIKYSKEALEIYPDSKDVNFYLAMFYYKSSEPSDVKAKNLFIKVITLDPDNVEANVALAELYYKHKNRVKARRYALRALELDPTNKRSKFILDIIEK
ncbi:MAG: tetratricopeptide repeat protein [Spirochaetota bacterium]|nr:tetratricopeptide repeat protein [Spirochaetota bacterium]